MHDEKKIHKRKAETEAKSKADISDIVNAKVENDISFQNDIEVAA